MDNNISLLLLKSFLYITGKLSAGEFRDIKCTNLNKGRFVAIHLVKPGILTVCELEIYGGKSVFDLIFDCPHFGTDVQKRVYVHIFKAISI